MVGPEPIFRDVGVTVSAMNGKVSSTDYAQVSAADTAGNEIYAISFVGADFTALLSFDALHEAAAIYAGQGYESTITDQHG